MRRKTCVVWNYFSDLSAQDALCKICGRNVRYHRSNTNLRSHLRVWHRKIWCEMTSGLNYQSSNYNSVPSNGVDFQAEAFNSNSTNSPYTSPPAVLDEINLAGLGSNCFRILSQEQQKQQQQQPLSPQPHISLQPKPAPLSSTPEHQVCSPVALQTAGLPKDIYITQNTSPDVSDTSNAENVSLSNFSESSSIQHSLQKPEEELSEMDRTRDSGVISIDECDILESKEVIAAQIEMMQPSNFANTGFTESSQTRNDDNSKISDPALLSNLQIASLNCNNSLAVTKSKSGDSEIDFIAEYFKICDNSTRQTFLDVMRNDRYQHVSALDSVSSELKNVSSLLCQVREEKQLKEEELKGLLNQANLLQMDILNLRHRTGQLSNQEEQLQQKLKNYNKKVSLCDSAVNAMTNGSSRSNSLATPSLSIRPG